MNKKLRLLLVFGIIIFLALIVTYLAFIKVDNISSVFFGDNSLLIKLLVILIPILLIIFIVLAFKKQNNITYRTDFVFEDSFTTAFDNQNLDSSDEKIANQSIDSNNDNENSEEVNTSDKRFYMLDKIDREHVTNISYDEYMTLEEICNDFRNFAAYHLHLYYSILDIRRFIGSLAVTHILILQGMSGTGKTSLAYAFGEYLNNKSVVVPVQPMWKERSDLIGYFNEFTKKFNETTLLYKMYEANYNDSIYITVLDEMNIARIEYYFAEFLSLLELPNPESRYLDVVSDEWNTDPKLLKNGKLKLPVNMWFIGTANNDDSTFAISDKVYDRAMVLNLDQKADVFEGKETSIKKISQTYLASLYKKAIDEYELSERNKKRLKELDRYLIKNFEITFGNRIMKQILTYVPVILACGGTELEALDDILARKVLRKLENKNPVYVKAKADDLLEYINELFGSDNLALTKEVIEHIKQNV